MVSGLSIAWTERTLPICVVPPATPWPAPSAPSASPTPRPVGSLGTKGERGEEAFLLLEGAATVDLGDTEVTVGPGAVIGELATLDPMARRNADVVTTEPSLVLVYDVQTFRGLAASDLHDVL